jgi:signal transduction histidine kinase
MNPLFYHTTFILLINLVGTYLCFLVFFSGQRRALRHIFICMMFSMFVWVDFAYAARAYGTEYYLPLFFLRIAWFITPIFFTLLYFFTIYLIDEAPRYKKVSVVVMITGIILAFLCGMTDLVIAWYVYFPVETKLDIIYGQGMIPFFAVVFLIICATLLPLFNKYERISKEEKAKIQFYLVGIFIFYVANTIFNIILPAFLGVSQFYYFGDYSTIFFLILTAYAITKKRLMDAKVFMVELMVFLILVVLMIDFIFLSNDPVLRAFKLIVLMGLIYFGKELVLSVQKEEELTEQIAKANSVLAERNRDLDILLKTSDMINRNLDSRKISQDIVDSIPKSLRYLGYNLGIIFLRDEAQKDIDVYAVTDSGFIRTVEKEMAVTVKEARESFSRSKDLIVSTILNKKMYVSAKMGDFFRNILGEEKCAAVQATLRAKAFVSVPLFAAGQAMGAIVFSSEKTVERITQRNKDILRAFAAHIGSAIENAKLYERTNRQMKELAALNLHLDENNARLKELLEMKNEFLHITSHQLRTPLTAIRGMIAMWLDGDFDKMPEAERREMLRRIYVSTERLNNITNDMLDVLELEGGVMKFEMKKIQLLEMVKDTIVTLRPDYEKKGLYLRLGRVDENLPEVEGEPNYLSQVFMNLVDNACKYTRTGGTEIDMIKREKYIDVLIKDTGVGMDPKDIGTAFEKFTRGENASKENASGSGLGLFIVKKILGEHNGQIEVKSEGLGKGTTFKVSILIKQN